MQEFFAAKHLVNPKTKENIESFVCDHMNHGKWKVVLQFVAGLLNSSSDIFTKLLPKPNEGEWPATKKDKDLAVQVCKCLHEINDEQQPVLQNKMEKINFNEVDFSSCSLEPFDVAAVLHFLENAKEVFSIDLSDNNFGDLGANEVKKFIFKRELNLKRLDLSRNNLTNKAAKDFASALQRINRKLESLDLGGNNFTDSVAKGFAEALEHSNCKLRKLYLSERKFTDNAAKVFAAALGHSNCKLEWLLLSRKRFTNEGCQYLSDAGNKSNCHVLFL